MSPGKAALASPHPGNGHHRQLESGVGGWKMPSVQGLANGVSSLAQRRLSRPLKPLPSPRLNWEHSGSLEECHCFPVPCGARPSLTSPRCPTATRAQVGWKAPVPQASRWVRLCGCSTRTKLAHST